MTNEQKQGPSFRKQEIVTKYLDELEKHLTDLKSGTAERTFEIKDLANLLFIHPTHLSNSVHEVLGKSPCDIYEAKLMDIAKGLIISSNKPVT